MGWFSKKNEVRRDPRTGLLSVKVGDTWVEETPQMMVSRDFMKYFRDKNMHPADAMNLSAWVCGFMAGSIVGAASASMDQPNVQTLIQQLHEAMAEGLEAGRQAQDPAITAARENARG